MVKSSSISLIRFLSMLMIIMCHFLQAYGNKFAFWVNVGVQLFFVISGYLYGAKNVDNVFNFYKIQFRKILVPYIVLVIIIFLLEFIFFNRIYSFSLMVGSLFGLGAVNGTAIPLSHTWFITYILICYLMIPVLQYIFNNDNFKNNVKKFIFLVICIQGLNFFHLININACWLNIFAFGYFYRRCCDDIKKQNIFKFVILILFMSIFPFAVILQENIDIVLPKIFDVYSKYIVNYGHALLGILLFLVLFDIFNKIKIKYNLILKFSDKYSYYIFLVHQVFILNTFSLLGITDFFIFNIFIILIVTIIVSVILKILSDNIYKYIRKIITLFSLKNVLNY